MSTYVLSALEEPAKPHEVSDKRSLQGRTTRFTDPQISFVVDQYKSYAKERKRIKINAFMKHMRNHWQKQSWLTPPPSRKTVEDMLLADGCREPKQRTTHKSQYYPAVKRYFPHAQTVLDGKQVIVSLSGQDHSFVMEFSKDMATDAIGGYAVGTSETSELVKRAFYQHCHNHQKPIATLFDNGSGNNKAAIDLGSEGVLVIKAHPYRAETKGQIEGEFGLFEKKVSSITIAGKSEKQQAMSILKTIAEIYLRLRNQTSRCSVCPFTPEKLMKAKLDTSKTENAYQQLKAQQNIKKQQTEQQLKISQQLNDLLESIVKEHQLTGDLLRFKRGLKWVELATIREAESQFAIQSNRDNFNSGKRTMAYFYAIARNMQQQKDQLQKQQTARQRYSLDKKNTKERKKIRAEIAGKKQKNNQPYLKIIEAMKAEINLPTEFRASSTIFKEQMDQGILSILKRKRQNQKTLVNKTFDEIMALNEYSIETRYELIEQMKKRIKSLTQNKAIVVTPN